MEDNYLEFEEHIEGEYKHFLEYCKKMKKLGQWGGEQH